MGSMLIPGMRIKQYQQQAARGANGLTLLRIVFIQFAAMLVVFGVVLALLDQGRTQANGGVALWTGIVAIAGVVGVVAPRVLRTPLNCSSDLMLAGTYRTRFFLRIAFGEMPALVGFVAFFVAGELWLYFLGCAFAAIAYVYAAPAKRNLIADQHALHHTGCERSLIAALVGGMPHDDE